MATVTIDVDNAKKEVKEAAIVLFLIWNFSGIFLWLSPDGPLKQNLISPFLGYLNCFGLWQGWSVFESPRTYNEYLTALVTYKDGSQKIWEFPRMEKLGMVDKMYKEGYRRWTNDCVSDTKQAFLWPDATRFVARANNRPGNPPTQVALIRHWTWIDPPQIGVKKPLRSTDDGQETLCTQAISADELL